MKIYTRLKELIATEKAMYEAGDYTLLDLEITFEKKQCELIDALFAGSYIDLTERKMCEQVLEEFIDYIEYNKYY